MAQPDPYGGGYVYQGTGEPHDGIDRLPAPPPWSVFDDGPVTYEVPEGVRRAQRAQSYRADDMTVQMVNAALLLRRPLLVTGSPGSGKSSLAYSIAYELKLGPVIRWPVTRGSTLRSALYSYDAIGRLQEASTPAGLGPPSQRIGDFIRLGPLGTALLPTRRPRVLLIDEFDNSDFDLPSELLAVLEEGEFMIPELMRGAGAGRLEAEVVTEDGRPAVVRGGRVRCRHLPMIVVTSSGEREFPPRFLRRCLRLDVARPEAERLLSIVTAHLGTEFTARGIKLIEEFLNGRDRADLGVDQLLNAIFLTASWAAPDAERLAETLLRSAEAGELP
ncbi:MoxR family ATPase [Actinomadura sp. NPDC048021]|uniref:MoxR family ATPase n=1 Tax=Actinomadura sp. NPDC048021 TaxID=3155385 RepID=UPI0033D92255